MTSEFLQRLKTPFSKKNLPIFFLIIFLGGFVALNVVIWKFFFNPSEQKIVTTHNKIEMKLGDIKEPSTITKDPSTLIPKDPTVSGKEPPKQNFKLSHPQYVKMLPPEGGGGYEIINEEKFKKNLDEFDERIKKIQLNSNFFHVPYYLHAIEGASDHFRTGIPVGERTVVIGLLDIDHDREERIEYFGCKPDCHCERKRYLFSCQFSENIVKTDKDIPDYITLSLKGWKGDGKIHDVKVPIEKEIMKAETDSEIGICIQSVVYNDNPKRGFLPDSLFKEWLDHNDKMGISQVHIYTNNSLLVDAGSRINLKGKKIKVFFHDMLAPNYENPGWHGSSCARGMTIWLQHDCLARSRSAGLRWAYYTDFDEFVFPDKHKNLLEALEAEVTEQGGLKKTGNPRNEMDEVLVKAYRYDTRYCTKSPKDGENPNGILNAVEHACICYEDFWHKFAARVTWKEGKEDPIPVSTHIEMKPWSHELRGPTKRYRRPSPYVHFHHLRAELEPMWSKEVCKYIVTEEMFKNGISIETRDNNFRDVSNVWLWKPYHVIN